LKRLRNDMYACGQSGLPQAIYLNGQKWTLETVFKHDFFACTGRYQCHLSTEKVVLKISRLQSFFGIPCAWLGRMLRNHELTILRHLADIEEVPHIIRSFGHNGFLYYFIEGQSLDEKPAVPDDFFSRLRALLAAIHKRDVCYIDLNKRGNILLGKDGRPYLIDFQISLHLPGRWCRFLRTAIQREDMYHLLKHHRKFRPDLLTPEETQRSRQPSGLIRLHRLAAHPYRQIRRALFRFLYKSRILTPDDSHHRTPENDPNRFLQ